MLQRLKTTNFTFSPYLEGKLFLGDIKRDKHLEGKFKCEFMEIEKGILDIGQNLKRHKIWEF